MQDELAADHPDLGIDLLVVNGAGHESGLRSLFAETELPVLQDDTTADVWANWGAAWRDVYVVDHDNELVTVYNLTTYDLSDRGNYDALYELFVTAAGG